MPIEIDDVLHEAFENAGQSLADFMDDAIDEYMYHQTDEYKKIIKEKQEKLKLNKYKFISRKVKNV